MEFHFLRFGATAALGLLLSACVHGAATTRSLPQQVVDPKKADSAIVVTPGNIDGTPFALVTTVRLFPQDGALALCAGTSLLAIRDLSPYIRTAMAEDKSVLTLRRADGQSVTLKPAFLPVTYRAVPATPDGTIGFVPSEVGESDGACVATDRSWQPQWAGNVQGTLALYAMDTRKRSRTVVGGAP